MSNQKTNYKIESLSLALFCAGIALYALGINRGVFGINAQSFFHIGGIIFIFSSFKIISWGGADYKILKIPLFSCGILLFLALFTYFDTIMPPRNFGALLKAINSHIVNPLVLFSLCYFFARYARIRAVFVFFAIFAILCAINSFAMLYLALENGFYHESFRQNVPFFFKTIYTYNIWILAPLAISLAGLAVFHQIKARIFFVLCLILSFLAMLSNGERSFFVAFGAMICAPFIFWRYKNKARILPTLALFAILAFFGIYQASKNFSPRYNLANMIDNFATVWAVSPSAMGQFDKFCFHSKWLICARESLESGKSEIEIEHSALSRINMTKSTLLAFLDSPLQPRVVGVFQVGEYLHKYYEIHNQENRSYISFANDKNNLDSNGYNHPHNFVVSLLFCFGIVGFGAIVVSQLYLLFIARRAICADDRLTRFISLALIIFLCGLWTQSLFDGIYGIILQTIFIMLGACVGFITRQVR